MLVDKYAATKLKAPWGSDRLQTQHATTAGIKIGRQKFVRKSFACGINSVDEPGWGEEASTGPDCKTSSKRI